MADTLYFDARCPRCNARAHRLRRDSGGQLQLLDIHSQGLPPDAPGRLLLLRTLHLRTARGHWLTGLDAALRAHSYTHRGALLRPLAWPGLRHAAGFIYNQLELRRYRQRYGCAGCAPAED